jgi:hypothetical protein
MNAYTMRRAVAACAVAGCMLMVPAESQAIFHWFGGGCCGGGTTAYRPYTAAYAPYYAAYPAAPACNTCSPCAQTCNYVPQTCYRVVYQQVPVTACQPVPTCDPCGGQVTAMRPVVTYQMQARVVPYTTYRPVYAPMVSYAPAAVGCPTGNCGTSVTYAAPASTSGCSTCNTPSYSTPSYTTPGSQGVPGSSVPSLPPMSAPQSSEPTPSSTFKNGSDVPDSESRLRPIPDPSTQNGTEASNKSTNSTLTPRLLNSDDRTTYRPLKRTVTVIPVTAEERVDDEGWRPAKR